MHIRVQNGEVTQTGGVVRVQHGAPAPETSTPLQAPHQLTRVGNQVHRFEGGEVKSVGVTRHQAAADGPSRPGVMATARHEGGVLSVELEPGNPASRTGIESALREGLIRQTGPGIYEDVPPLPAGTNERQQSSDAPPEDALFSDRKENQMWSEAIEPLTQGSYDHAVAGAVAAVAAGSDDFEGVARSLAQANGLEVQEAHELVSVGFDWHKRTLTEHLAKAGLVTPDNAQQFYDSIASHPQLTRALQEVAIEGKTSTFRSLAAAWRRDGSLRTQAAMKDNFSRAGMDSMVDPKTGELLVRKGSGPWAPLSKL